MREMSEIKANGSECGVHNGEHFDSSTNSASRNKKNHDLIDII